MCSASGHKTIAPKILSQKIGTNLQKSTNLIEKILKTENSTKGLVIITDFQPELVLEFLKLNFVQIDGLILINNAEKWHMFSQNNEKNSIPTVLVEDNEQSSKKIAYQKLVHINKSLELDSRKKLMQIIANFLDFIHPR